MSAFNITNSLRTVAASINPANWTSESHKVAAKVAKVTLVAYVALTAVQNLPTAIAASREYVYYNCGNGPIANAVYAFGSVLYNSWDLEKAREASSMMYTLGSKLYEGAKNHGVTNTNEILRACLAASNQLPYVYYN